MEADDSLQTGQSIEIAKDPCACIVSMEEWVQHPSEVCRPCLLGPVTQWYRDELQEKGLNDLAKEVEEAVDSGPVVLATKLDEVKNKVSPELKARLREFDCHAQLYREEKSDGGN
jgi:G3E family GTPase